MEIFDSSFDIASQQAKATGQAFQIFGAYAATMLEATVAFTRTSTERSAAMGASLMSAKTFDAAAVMYDDFVRDSMSSTRQFAAKLADALTLAAKDCQKLSATSVGGAPVQPRADGA
jgi:hypothetical protein